MATCDVNEKGPPALPGEVWRGVIRGDTFAVALQGAVTIWRWSLTCWVTPSDRTDREDAVNAWAMAERAARVQAEALAKAERVLRCVATGAAVGGMRLSAHERIAAAEAALIDAGGVP